MKRAVIAILLASAVPGHALAQSQSNESRTPVALAYTESRVLRSTVIPGREFLLYVADPTAGGDAQISIDKPASGKLPTLYFLDAYNQFGLVLQTYRLLRAFGDIPPLLIVGISYRGTGADFIRNRAMDFLPTTLTPEQIEKKYGKTMAGLLPASGGAATFLTSLSDEIIPFVEREYPANPNDRAIFGLSAGGAFSAYVLFTRPTLFQRYLIGSSAVWWDDFAILRDEERYAASHRDLPAKVVATVGTDEGTLIVGGWEKLRDRLAARAYKDLTFTPILFDDATHVSVVGRTYSVALRRLYGTTESASPGKTAAQTPGSRPGDEASIRAADAAWAEAVGAKSVDRTLAFYDPEAVTAGSAMFPAQGLEPLRANWEKLFANPGFALTWTAQKVVVVESGTTAYSTGTWKLGDAQGPYIAVWRKQPDGTWKVLVDGAWTMPVGRQ